MRHTTCLEAPSRGPCCIAGRPLQSLEKECRLNSWRSRRHSLTVNNALSRKGKEEAVEKLTKAFEESAVVFGLRFKGVTVKQLEQLRRSIPEDGAHLYVVKNNLLKLAADRVDGWSELKQAAKGDNAWIFANEDNVATCVKAFLDFEKALKAPLPREQRAKAKPTDITGGVLEGQYLDYGMIAKLEKMPTKLELIRDAAIMIKKVPTTLAITIKAVPTKLGKAISLLAEGDENKELLVGDVFPKAPASEAP